MNPRHISGVWHINPGRSQATQRIPVGISGDPIGRVPVTYNPLCSWHGRSFIHPSVHGLPQGPFDRSIKLVITLILGRQARTGESHNTRGKHLRYGYRMPISLGYRRESMSGAGDLVAPKRRLIAVFWKVRALSRLVRAPPRYSTRRRPHQLDDSRGRRRPGRSNRRRGQLRPEADSCRGDSR